MADATNQPDAVREVFLLDDDDGDLNNGTPNYDDLVRAAVKRKLPYPARLSHQPDMVHYAFDSGVGNKETNLATQRTTTMTGANVWASPGGFGQAALRGSDNTSSASHYVESDFRGPLYGDLTLHLWMRERINPGPSALTYLCGGLHSFRVFTGGAALDGLEVRDWGGSNLTMPSVGPTLQDRARNPGGVCVTLTVDGRGKRAQFYIDGVAHGSSIVVSGPVDVAAAANGFRIGKFTSDTYSSAYDLDEVRLLNRVAPEAEIRSWCEEQKSLYFKFDRGVGDLAIDYGTTSGSSPIAGSNPWQAPGKFGTAMLRGSNNNQASSHFCTTAFRGPIYGSATFHWWMKQRVAPGSSLSYLWGGLGSLRCFTNGVASTGLWMRSGVGVDLELNRDLQTLARNAAGVWIGLTIDAASRQAQWYVDGYPSGDWIAIPGGMIVDPQSSPFVIGKHTSDTNSSAYDIDEFRFENRAVRPDEILSWTRAPTAATGRMGSPCGIRLSSLGGNPTTGNPAYTHMIQATPAAATTCLFVIGVQARPQFDMGIAFRPLTGCTWFPSFDLQLGVTTNGNGSRAIPGAVPRSSSAVGAHLDIQVLGFQGNQPLQSNATSHVIELR